MTKRPITEVVSENVKRLRTMMKLSRLELAARCGVHERTILRIEAGFDIRLLTLQKVAHGIGVTLNYLLEDQS